MISIEPAPVTGFYEAPFINIKHQESVPFANLLRTVILSKIPQEHLDFDLSVFDSTDSHIGYDDLVIQFRQIHIGKGLEKVSFYLENKTNDYIPYKTSHILVDKKPIDCAKYEVSDYIMGYLNSGCYVDIKKIDVKQHTKFTPAFSFEWLEDGMHLRFRSHDSDIVNKACDFIIGRYKHYKNRVRLDEDEGPFGHLISQEGLKMGYNIKATRRFYTEEKYSLLEGNIDEINKVIDLLISKFEKLKK